MVTLHNKAVTLHSKGVTPHNKEVTHPSSLGHTPLHQVEVDILLALEESVSKISALPSHLRRTTEEPTPILPLLPQVVTLPLLPQEVTPHLLPQVVTPQLKPPTTLRPNSNNQPPVTGRHPHLSSSKVMGRKRCRVTGPLHLLMAGPHHLMPHHLNMEVTTSSSSKVNTA